MGSHTKPGWNSFERQQEDVFYVFLGLFFVESSSPQKSEDSTFLGVVGLSGSGDSGWSHKKGWNSQISLSKGLSKHFLHELLEFHVYLLCIRKMCYFLPEFSTVPPCLFGANFLSQKWRGFIPERIHIQQGGNIWSERIRGKAFCLRKLCQIVREDDNKH